MIKDHNHDDCAVLPALDVLFGKWKISILYLLFHGTHRFSELKRNIPGITTKMLMTHLRDLEEKDIIQRTVYPVVPPRVEYSLTESGQSLGPILAMMHQWGVQHEKRLKQRESMESITRS